jgi:hypothetical protein
VFTHRHDRHQTSANKAVARVVEVRWLMKKSYKKRSHVDARGADAARVQRHLHHVEVHGELLQAVTEGTHRGRGGGFSRVRMGRAGDAGGFRRARLCQGS